MFGSIVSRNLVSVYFIFTFVTLGFFGLLLVDETLNTVGVARASITVNDDGGADYTTIQAAIDNASDNETIYVWEGIYYENITVNKSVQLIGNGTVNTTVSSGGGIQITADWVNVSGFAVTGSYYGAINLQYVQNCHIYDNNCSNNFIGISLIGSDNNLVENNNCGNNSYGIFLMSASNSNIIKNNTLEWNEYGISFGGKGNNIFNNSCIMNIYTGIQVSGEGNYIFYNSCYYYKPNVFDSEVGIYLRTNFSNIIRNNNLTNCSFHMGGDKLDYWDSHIIESNNTVNGKSLYYLRNLTGGVAPADAGQIILANCSNVTVENQNISDSSISILLGFSNNTTIRNNTCNNNSISGVYIFKSNYTIIENNTCISNPTSGVTIYSSHYNTILNNTINSNTEYGIYLYLSNNNLITGNNSLLDNRYGLSMYFCDSNIVENNNCSNNKMTGLITWYSKYTKIINNIINRNYYGIDSYESESIDYEYNTINSNRLAGFFIQWSNANNINNNTCNSNGAYGLILSYSYQNCIFNNSCNANNLTGIDLYHSYYNSLENNTCNNTYIGINLGGSYSNDGSSFNKIQNNSCSSNEFYGIYLGYSIENEIINNTCNCNNDTGIYIRLDSDNNRIINNTVRYNNGTGIYINYSDENTIINNKCEFNDKHGIHLDFFSKRNILDNNIISSNNDSGIFLDDSSANTLINNTCENNLNGIYLRKSSSNTIENNWCWANEIGIILYHYSSSNEVKNNSCSNNFNYGILLDDHAFMNSIINNNCSKGFFSTYAGIYLFTSNLTLIKNNDCSSNSRGIILSNSNQNQIITNNCSDCTTNSIYLILSNENLIDNNSCVNTESNSISVDSSFYNIIRKNICRSLYNDGINLDGSRYNTIENNICDNNSENGIKVFSSYLNRITNNSCCWNGEGRHEGGGIYIYNSNLNNVDNNTCYFNFNSACIHLHYSYFNDISNNSCKFNRNHGIFVETGNDNTIQNNTCSKNSNSSGIYLSSCRNSNIINNTCEENKYGLDLSGSDDNKIIANKFMKNTYGIQIEYSENNEIFGNEVSYSQEIGFSIRTLTNVEKANEVYHNMIISNSNQAFVKGASIWHNDLFQGNYWSDYTGVDNGANDRPFGDGIGDTQIPHLNLDYYPYVNPYGWLAPKAPLLIDPGEVDTDGSYVISWIINGYVEGIILEEDDNSAFDSPVVILNSTDTSIFQVSFTNKPNGFYYYRIKAYIGTYHSTWSKIVDITVDLFPTAPTNLQVDIWPVGNALNISWDLQDNWIVSYELQVKTVGDWTIIANASHPTQTFNHTGLTNGIRYYYKLRVWDHLERASDFCQVVSGVPQDSMPPDAPNRLKIMKRTFNSITVGWDKVRADDVAGYNVYHSDTPSPDTYGKPINGRVLVKDTFYEDTNLKEGTSYYYVVSAVDEVPNESLYSDQIQGTTYLFNEYPQPPYINQPAENISIPEDTADVSINLNDWFSDINGDSLLFNYSGNEHINVTIFQNNGTVLLISEKDWNGRETLIFYANDGVFEIFDELTITVTAVNDPPGPVQIISPEAEAKIQNNSFITFIGECFDPDLPYGDVLTYRWISSLMGILGEGKTLLNIQLTTGDHEILLVVSDSFNLTTRTSINISVVEPEAPKPDEEQKTDLSIMAIIGIGILIIILVIVLVFLILRRKLSKSQASKTDALRKNVPIFRKSDGKLSKSATSSEAKDRTYNELDESTEEHEDMDIYEE